MRELFVHTNFKAKSEELIKRSNIILDEYYKDGFVLTLRQLYYQFVARGWFDNTFSNYKKLQQLVNDARLAGRIDWEMIEDRTRSLLDLPNWDDPESAIQGIEKQFKFDIWAKQKTRVEVWVEKEALAGVVERTCVEFRVPFYACRGYNSQSEQWRAGHRIQDYLRSDQKVLILHLGDHDPSGLDMSRDNENRLSIFSRHRPGLMFKRIGLNMDQIEQYDPPPNFVKMTDSRAAGYKEEFDTEESWELDALQPRVIDELIRREIKPLINKKAWNTVLAEEKLVKETFGLARANYQSMEQIVKSLPRPE